jgi:hypothetical protein
MVSISIGWLSDFSNKLGFQFVKTLAIKEPPVAHQPLYPHIKKTEKKTQINQCKLFEFPYFKNHRTLPSLSIAY